jgi:hypothetical protein
MHKTADIDPMTVARHGVGGALLGGSSAAIVSLIHAINLARRQRKEMQDTSETDENTIVLRLPMGKTAEVTCAGDLPIAIKHTDKPTSVSKKVPAKSYRAGFYPNQEMKTADWQTLTASILAATGGGMLGYHLIDKAYRASLQRKLKAQEEASRDELLDSMMHQPKVGNWLDDIFSVPEEKEAQFREKSRFSYMDAPFAVAALMALLGTGGTAYITKKILDSKIDEQRTEFNPPRVQRIVFKSAEGPLEEGEELATADDLEAIHGALAITMDKISGAHALLEHPIIASELAETDKTAEDLYKWAQADVNPLVAFLQNNPQLRQSIQRISMDQHPLLRHFTGMVGLPGISNIADRMLYKKVNSIGAGLQGMGGHGQRLLDSITRELGNYDQSKQALAPISASFIGSTLAEHAMEHAIKRAPKPQMKADDEVEAEKVQEILNNIQLSASDPQAQAYLEENQDKIRVLLGQLAARGTL